MGSAPGDGGAGKDGVTDVVRDVARDAARDGDGAAGDAQSDAADRPLAGDGSDGDRAGMADGRADESERDAAGDSAATETGGAPGDGGAGKDGVADAVQDVARDAAPDGEGSAGDAQSDAADRPLASDGSDGDRAGTADARTGESDRDAADGSAATACAVPSAQDFWDVKGTFPSTVGAAWSVGPREVWVTTQPGRDTFGAPVASGVWRWNGTYWYPVLSGDETVSFDRLWASGAGDVWITGDRLRHWDGTAFADVAVPGLPAGARPGLIHGQAADDVWLTALTGAGTSVLHWDGSSWIDRTPPADAPGAPFGAVVLWVAGHDDVWLAGPSLARPDGGAVTTEALEHWNGTMWTSVLPPMGFLPSSMWGSSGSDIWAGGGATFHYDGTRWARQADAAQALFWGSCPTDVWGSTAYGSLSHFDGTAWTARPSIPFNAVNGLTTALTGTGPDDFWLSAAQGIARQAPPVCPTGFQDCDHNPTYNGCEADTLIDSVNCGTCGTYCVGGTSCVNGACVQAGATCPTGCQVTRFPVGGSNRPGLIGLAVGSDGNLWFAKQSTNTIGRMQLDGTVTEWTVPTANASPRNIIAGPDGNLWFVDAAGIGRITVQGSIVEFSTSANLGIGSLTVGPDGNVWFLATVAVQVPGLDQPVRVGKVGRISPAGAIVEFQMEVPPSDITSGPDGNLWVTSALGIARVTPAGAITQLRFSDASVFPLQSIVTGPDGNLWFAQSGRNEIGRLSVSGAFSEVPTTVAVGASLLTPGPGGTVWFSEASSGLGRITPDGVATDIRVGVPIITGLVQGPDGAMWFADDNGGSIGRLVP
jgi:virginiamycin B lyase